MYVNVYIDASEFYYDLTASEKSELLRWLVDDGFTLDDMPGNPDIIEHIKEQIYRIKYKGLDSDKTTVEILEGILAKAE